MTKSLYQLISDWQQRTFTEATPYSCVKHLQEEVEELKKSIEEHENGMPDYLEIADCLMLLIGICQTSGMTYEDIVEAIAEKWKTCRSRKWEMTDKGYKKHA